MLKFLVALVLGISYSKAEVFKYARSKVFIMPLMLNQNENRLKISAFRKK